MTVSTRNTVWASVGLASVIVLGGIANAGGGSGGSSPVVVPGAGMGGATMGGGHHGGPKDPCCKGPKGPSVHIPGVHVSGPNVVVHGSHVSVHQGSYVSNTQSYLNTSIVSESDSSVFVSGGGGYHSAQGVLPTAINQLNVEGGEETYLETITEQIPVTEEFCEDEFVMTSALRPIQAVCIDDKGVPHPASQVDASDRVPSAYSGEVFRCMAGTRMHVTMGHVVEGQASFEHGEAFGCRKGEALVHKTGGDLMCAPQVPARSCNERSLLRRHGPGLKLVETRARTKTCVPRTRTVMQSVERQVERVRETKAQSMVFDGGVGQGVY